MRPRKTEVFHSLMHLSLALQYIQKMHASITVHLRTLMWSIHELEVSVFLYHLRPFTFPSLFLLVG